MTAVEEAPTGTMPGTLQIDFPPGDDWLSAEELATLTPEVLRQRIVDIAPLAAERAISVEQNRRPDAEVWAELRKSGIFYMLMPKALGGLEMNLRDLLDVMTPLAEACASTCWCATFLIEHNVGIIKSYPLEMQKKIFGEFPYVSAPGVTAPPGIATKVEGGYRISGQYAWGSGVMNSDWVMGLAMVIDPDAPPADGPPTMIGVMVPATEVTVLDTWHMAGMAGTGSNDVVFDDVFVADEFVGRSPLEPLAKNEDGGYDHDTALLHVPFPSLLSLTTMLPVLGIAKAAVNFTVDNLPKRAVYGVFSPYAEKEAVQVRLGKAEAMVRTAEVALYDAADRIVESASNGQVDFASRSQLRAQIMAAVDLCRDAVRMLIDAAGASGFKLDSPMQRYFRDLHVIHNHPLYDSDMLYEQRGRALLGMDQTDFLT